MSGHCQHRQYLKPDITSFKIIWNTAIIGSFRPQFLYSGICAASPIFSQYPLNIQQILPSNFADLTLSANLCCINTFITKTHTAFQLLHEANIRLTILSGVTCNPIVLSRQHRYRASTAFWACVVYIVAIIIKICFTEFHGLLTAVSSGSSSARGSFWYIHLSSV